MDLSELTYVKYDHNGNIIYRKLKNGEERWTQYDEKGNVISGKSTTGFGFVCDYDENNNEIHRKYNDGKELWFQHDEHGNIINAKDNRNEETKYKYNERGQEILRQRSSDGGYQSREYDELGNLVYFYDSDTKITKTHEFLDDVKWLHSKETKNSEILYEIYTKVINKNLTYYIDSENKWRIMIFDDNDRNIMSINSNNEFNFTAYNENGDIIYDVSNGIHTYAEYDEYGRNTHTIDSAGFEEWLDYDKESGLLTSYRNNTGHEVIFELSDE